LRRGKSVLVICISKRFYTPSPPLTLLLFLQ
jgi:hypothetical protein